MTDATRHCGAEPQWAVVSMSHRGGLVKADVDHTGFEGGNLNDARRTMEKFQVRAGLANAARGLFA